MKLFSILPILISGEICLLDHATKSCEQKFEPSFCNGNGANVSGRCTGDSPRLLNLNYTCVLEDNGQVRAKFSLAEDVSDDLQDKIIFANKLAEFERGFNEVTKLAKRTTELVLAEDTATNVGGVKTLYATIGTMPTAPKITPFGIGKPDYGDNYKIECKVRSVSFRSVSYMVMVSTSNKFWSGTSDTVYMQLVSDFGTSGITRVTSDLKRGNSVVTSLTAPYYGDLEKIVLFKGGSDLWRLERVDVQYTITDKNGISRTNKYASEGPHEGYTVIDESNPVAERKLTKL